MEPRIRYAQTAGGVSTAFWTLGEGLPLVLRQLAAGKGFRCVDRGKTQLRGFDEPVELYEGPRREKT